MKKIKTWLVGSSLSFQNPITSFLILSSDFEYMAVKAWWSQIAIP
jgi:hypothetical protein